MTAWTEPKWPGDAVRIVLLARGDEIGDVRIQQYGEHYCVATFLPGRPVCSPGDTPKTEPEESRWFTKKRTANLIFDQFERRARADGWTDYRRGS